MASLPNSQDVTELFDSLYSLIYFLREKKIWLASESENQDDSVLTG